MDYFPSSIVIISETMTDDNPTPITNKDIPFYNVNLHCYSNSLYYGYGGVFAAKIEAGDVVWLEKGNLRDIMVQNVSAGSNGQIVAVATVPNKYVQQELK